MNRILVWGSIICLLIVLYFTKIVSAQSPTSCQTDPARLTCFESWRSAFTSGIYSTDADMNKDNSVTLSDYEVWRRAYTTVLPTPTTANPNNITTTVWKPVDLAFTTSTSHPWYNFPLTVTFINGNTSLTLDAFFDGTDTNNNYVWKIRFTPTLTGVWNWTSTSIDSALTGQSGVVTANAPSPSEIQANPNYRGHIRISANKRYFQYPDATPFLLMGDTVWDISAIRSGVNGGDYNNDHFYRIVDDRKAKGFTTIFIQYFSRDNRNEGGYAFPDNRGADPGNGNFTNLNPDYFKSVDTRMNYLWQKGLVVAGHPSWISEWNITLADAQNIHRYLLSRYGAYNIIISLSGEYQYGYDTSGRVWTKNDWTSLGNFVSGKNVYFHPLSIHPSGRTDWGANAGKQSSSGEFQSDTWLDHNWLQTGQSGASLYRVAGRTEENYNLTSPVRPVIHSEGLYENNISGGSANDYQIRWQAWEAILNGAAGHAYGANGVFQVYDPSDPKGETGLVPHDSTAWNQALAYSGSTQIGYVASFFKSIAWQQLFPRRNVVKVNGSSATLPTSSDLTPPQAAGDIYSLLFVVYIPMGNGGKTIELAGLNPSKSYTARFYNPRNGTHTEITGDPSGVINWTVPARPDSNDWVLFLAAI